ncbi:MAG: DUF1573 domain-containing protein [Bacteroides sp.]|nr:DUF1573 domain-containing protein [Bacteroides sp.]MBP3679942.1 DUF1573 domain-containing protein [Bacteroidaceae bacterium]
MRIINRLIMLCALLFITSCGETDKDRINRLVKEWEGKEIKFPPHSIFTVLGKDTVDFSFVDADYKVLTYIDSVGCASCKLQLHRWKEWVHEVDSLTGGKVPFIFYFHPKDMKELRYLTRRDGFSYPVCFDEKDELNRLNHFPSDMTFQTFLLDRDNKVMAIGNPVHNPKVKELYLDLITGKESPKTVGNSTKVSVNQTAIDFGSFPQSEKQERSFVLTNTGNQLLVIQDVTTSCGCTKVEYSKEPVRPGTSLELKVIYEAEKAEFFNKAITVYCNADNSPLRLTIVGRAK